MMAKHKEERESRKLAKAAQKLYSSQFEGQLFQHCAIELAAVIKRMQSTNVGRAAWDDWTESEETGLTRRLWDVKENDYVDKPIKDPRGYPVGQLQAFIDTYKFIEDNPNASGGM